MVDRVSRKPLCSFEIATSRLLFEASVSDRGDGIQRTFQSSVEGVQSPVGKFSSNVNQLPRGPFIRGVAPFLLDATSVGSWGRHRQC